MAGLYSIYDYKAGSFCPPFVAENDVDAERQVVALFYQASDIPPVLYPNDFGLIKLAHWLVHDGLTVLADDEAKNFGTLFEISVRYKKQLETSQALMRRLFEKNEEEKGKDDGNK